MLNRMLKKLFDADPSQEWESQLTQVDDEGHISRYPDSAFDPERRSGSDNTVALLGLCGRETAVRAHRLALALSALAGRPAVTVHEWNLVIREATTLSDLGNTQHTLAEVKSAPLNPVVEPVPLLHVVGGVLAKRANHLRRNGVVLVPDLQACSVFADKELLRAMLETAIDWAAPYGNRLTVSCGPVVWGNFGVLEVRADDVVRSQGDAPKMFKSTGKFQWELLVELCAVARARVRRHLDPERCSLTFELPLKAEAVGVAHSHDFSVTSFDSAVSSSTDLVVFLEGRAERMVVERVLEKAGFKPRYVNNALAFERECELIPPQAIILDASAFTRQVHGVLEEVRRYSRKTAVVVLTAERNVYDLSGPGGGSCRLSLASVEDKLVEALNFELAQR